MNGRTARALRKEALFHPKNEREYKTFEVTTRAKRILQWDGETGGVKEVIRTGTALITECVDGSRKMYQYYKRKFNNPDHTEILVPLDTVNQAREELAQHEGETI